MSTPKGKKKGKAPPPIYVHQDRKIVEAVLKAGPPYNFSDQWFCHNVSLKLQNDKVLDIEGERLKSRWFSLLDSKLEEYLKITGLGPKEQYGFNGQLPLEENVRAFESRLLTAYQMTQAKGNATASTSSSTAALYQSVPQHLRLQMHYKLPLVFRGSEEGDPSRDVSGFLLPPQIFRGFQFFLVDPLPGVVGAVCRSGLEHLIKYHGGQLITEWEKVKECTDENKLSFIVSIALTDEEKNKEFVNAGRALYKTDLVYECIENNEKLNNAIMSNYEWAPMDD